MTPIAVTYFNKCRACEGNFQEILSLGNQPVVDFSTLPNQEPKGNAPLDLVRCTACGLVQLQYSVEPTVLYDTFWYRSGINPMMVEALREIAQDAEHYGNVTNRDDVLDIGCNDGTLLRQYTKPRRKIGIDPAKNILPPDNFEEGMYFTEGLFSSGFAHYNAKSFKAITAIAMFYDLDDPLQFLYDVHAALTDDGVFIIQMNYLWGMLEQNAFDNICHEHVTYFSLSALEPLLEKAGFQVTAVKMNGVNGGSIRVICHKTGAYRMSLEDACSVAEVRHYEGKFDLYDELTDFRNRIDGIVGKLLHAVEVAEKPLYLYGASTRGHTLMQTLYTQGLNPKHIAGAAERDIRKMGRYPAGTSTRIVTEQEARREAKTFLVLPWHFLAGILRRESAWLGGGGKMIVPLPEPSIITNEGVTML